MKKNFFYLILLFSAVTLFSSCSEDEDVVSLTNTAYKGASLVLNYSDVPVLGKTAFVSLAESGSATQTEIKLSSNVIPGLQELILNVAIVGTAKDCTFEGIATVAENEVTYSGSIKGDVCTVNLTVVMPATPLTQKWHVSNTSLSLPDGATLLDNYTGAPIDNMTLGEPFISIKKWTTSEPVSISFGGNYWSTVPVEFYTQILTETVLKLIGILPLVKDVELLSDGNIVATINSAEIGATPAWETSQKGLAMYKVENENTIRLFLDPATIASTMPVTKSTDALGSLLALLGDVLANGIPIKYVVNEGELKPAQEGQETGNIKYVRFYLDKNFILPLLPVITPILNEITEEHVANLVGDDLSDMIYSLLRSFHNCFTVTTDMEISFNLLNNAPAK